MLGQFSVDDPDEVRLRPGRVLAGGSHPKDVTLVRAAHRHVTGHKVAFADLVIDLVLDVRKSRA